MDGSSRPEAAIHHQCRLKGKRQFRSLSQDAVELALTLSNQLEDSFLLGTEARPPTPVFFRLQLALQREFLKRIPIRQDIGVEVSVELCWRDSRMLGMP